MPRNPAVDEKSQKPVKSGYTDAVYADLLFQAGLRSPPAHPADLQKAAVLRDLYGIVGPGGLPRQQISWPKMGPVTLEQLGVDADTWSAICLGAAHRGLTPLAFLGALISRAVHGRFRRPRATPVDTAGGWADSTWGNGMGSGS